MRRVLLVFGLTLIFSLPTSNPVVATDGVLYIDSDYLQGYNRKLFKDQIDEDKDGCKTRAEVLIEEAVTKPKINKKIRRKTYAFSSDKSLNKAFSGD